MSENIKQVICIRKDLYKKVRVGKIMAQCAHASLKSFTDRITWYAHDTISISSNQMDVMVKWLKSDYRKIVVYVENEKELLELRDKSEKAGLITTIVIDNGLTEFNGQKTTTVLAIGPDYDSKINEITGHLKLM